MIENQLPTILVWSSGLVVFGGAFFVRMTWKRKRMYHRQEIQELQVNFERTLLQSKLEIHEQTLDRIAKEVHSNIGHLASLIQINLIESLRQAPKEMEDNLIEAKSLTKELLCELRALSTGLNTDYIKHVGITKALQNEVNRYNQRQLLKATLTVNGHGFDLTSEKQIILFRASQEILNNIIRYSKAKSVAITIESSPTSFALEFVDDGIGFDVENALLQSAEKGSTGLINLKKRAELIDADLSIRSNIGKGTTCSIRLSKNMN